MINEIYSLLLKEAKKAYDEGEIPVAAVIVKERQIIAYAHNLKENQKSVLAHAEILAIEKASKKLNNWRLDGCDIYITLEPCSMCASAIHQSRINNIYYFVEKEPCGKNKLIDGILVEKNCNKDTHMKFLDYGEELKILLQDFFKKRR